MAVFLVKHVFISVLYVADYCFAIIFGSKKRKEETIGGKSYF